MPKVLPLELLKLRLNEYQTTVVAEIVAWENYEARYFHVSDNYWIQDVEIAIAEVKKIANLAIEVKPMVNFVEYLFFKHF